VIENDELPALDHFLMSESLKVEITGYYQTYPIGSRGNKLYFGLNKEHSLYFGRNRRKFNLQEKE